MRYIVFSSALIVSLELFGASIANAIPTNGSAIVRANSTDVIKVLDGCGKHYHRDKSGACVAD
jgi:hypothetical protein